MESEGFEDAVLLALRMEEGTMGQHHLWAALEAGKARVQMFP